MRMHVLCNLILTMPSAKVPVFTYSTEKVDSFADAFKPFSYNITPNDLTQLKVFFFSFQPACGERDILNNDSSVCVRCVSVRLSEFVHTITSTIVDGFLDNLTQLFTIT